MSLLAGLLTLNNFVVTCYYHEYNIMYRTLENGKNVFDNLPYGYICNVGNAARGNINRKKKRSAKNKNINT